MKGTFKKFIIALVIINAIYLLLFSDEMEELGECFINGGIYYDLLVEDNIAYIASQYGLIILDVADSESPQLLGSVETPGTAFSLDLHEDIIALCYLYGSVDFIDVSDLSNPVKISTYNLGNTYINIRDVSMNDDLAVIYLDSGELEILDLSEINNPTLLHEILNVDAQKIEVVDNYIYALIDTNSGLIFQIYDISQPDNPILLGSANFPGWEPKNLVLEGNYAFIAADDKNLQIIEITDPNNPTLISECLIPGMETYDVAISDSYAYLIGSGEMSYAIVDISDPYYPEFIEGFDFRGSNIEINAQNAYICTNSGNSFINNGLAILDITDPTSFTIDTHFRSGLAEKLQVQNDVAYIANGFTGLTILDSSNPAEITYISNYQTSDSALDVLIDSTTAFVAVSESGVEIIDISNPAEPELISQIDTEYGKIRTLAIKDNNLYFGGEDEFCIYVYNIEDLENPQFVETISVNDYSYDLTIYDESLFLAGYWGGLQIFDISDASNAVEIGSYPLTMATSVAAGEDLVFINGNGLHIFDTSNFANPTIIETLDTGASDMHYQNNQLYFSFDGIYLYDLSNPEDIVETMYIPDCNPRGIAPQEDKIYSVERFRFVVYGDTVEVFSDEIELQEFPAVANISNYPNPFNPTTEISFQISAFSDQEAKVEIYNVKGQKVRSFLIPPSPLSPITSITWNGTDQSGNPVSSGIYFINVKSGERNLAQKKCLLLK